MLKQFVLCCVYGLDRLSWLK